MNQRAEEWLAAGSFFEWGPLKIFHAEFGDPEAPVLLLRARVSRRAASTGTTWSPH